MTTDEDDFRTTTTTTTTTTTATKTSLIATDAAAAPARATRAPTAESMSYLKRCGTLARNWQGKGGRMDNVYLFIRSLATFLTAV